MKPHASKRGAVLLELVVSAAIFVATGTLTLSIISNTITSFEREHDRMLAMDVARSLMSELEAGLISITQLSDGEILELGSMEFEDGTSFGGFDNPTQTTWRVEVDTQRTEWPGLTLVQLTVFVGPFDDDDAPRATLRQLVRLRDDNADAYEQDEMLEGLPLENGGSQP